MTIELNTTWDVLWVILPWILGAIFILYNVVRLLIYLIRLVVEDIKEKGGDDV